MFDWLSCLSCNECLKEERKQNRSELNILTDHDLEAKYELEYQWTRSGKLVKKDDSHSRQQTKESDLRDGENTDSGERAYGFSFDHRSEGNPARFLEISQSSIAREEINNHSVMTLDENTNPTYFNVYIRNSTNPEEQSSSMIKKQVAVPKLKPPPKNFMFASNSNCSSIS